MSRSTFTLFIGVFSVALYLFMTIFVVLFATVFGVSMKAVADSEDSMSEETKDLVENSAAISGYIFIILAVFFVMLVASILMVYGVKKERHQYIAPWVILSAISVVIELVQIFFEVSDSESDSDVFAYVLTAVISAGIWYPVFKHYQSLKYPKVVAVQGVECSSVGYVAPAKICGVPADYSHANAKYVPTAVVAAPQQNQVVYPCVPTYNV